MIAARTCTLNTTFELQRYLGLLPSHGGCTDLSLGGPLVCRTATLALLLHRPVLAVTRAPGRRLWANGTAGAGRQEKIRLNINVTRKGVCFCCYHHTSDRRFSFFQDERYMMPKTFLVLKNMFMKNSACHWTQNSILSINRYCEISVKISQHKYLVI